MVGKNADEGTSEPGPSAADGVAAKPEPVAVPVGARDDTRSAAPRRSLASRGSFGSFAPRLTRNGTTPVRPPAPAREAAPGLWQQFVAWLNGCRRGEPVENENYSTTLVERDDSLATLCGKLDTARLPQVALLISHGNQELSRPLGVRRLMRHAELTGKDVILVTRNLAIRQRAQAEGQPLASSPRRVRFQRLSGPGLQLGGLDLALPRGGTLLGVLCLALFLIGAFVAVFWYLPVATVTLYPRATPVTRAQGIIVDSQASKVNFSGFIVPAKRRQVDVSRSIFLATSGSANVNQANGQPLAVPAVADKDLKFAQDLASRALSDQGLSELKSRYGSADMVFPETAQVQVLSTDPKQKVGEASGFLEVTVRGSVSMLTASNDDLRQLFTSLLRAQVRNDQQFIDSSYHLTATAAGPYDKGADKLPVQIQAQVSVTRALDGSALGQKIEGKSRRDAANYLDRAVAPVQRPAIKLSPDWAPWLPRTPKHIHFDLRAAGSQ